MRVTDPGPLREQALSKANRTKEYRTRARREFREAGTSGALDLVAELLHFGQPQLLNTLMVGDLLTWVPSVRNQRASILCHKARVPYYTPLAGLDDRQRRAILHQVLTLRP